MTAAQPRKRTTVKLELLHIPDCPHTALALQQVEAALAALGRQDIAVHMVRIDTPEDAAGTGFAGSPTITADGGDIFPDRTPTGELACRLYPTPHGLAGVPAPAQMLEALKNLGL